MARGSQPPDRSPAATWHGHRNRAPALDPGPQERQAAHHAGFDEADWGKNARAAGWGILARGREQERVTLMELPAEERAPILREFPRKVERGVQFFRQLYGVPHDPEAFAAKSASRCPVFRIGGGTMV